MRIRPIARSVWVARSAGDVAIRRDLRTSKYPSAVNERRLPDCTFGEKSSSVRENTYSNLGE